MINKHFVWQETPAGLVLLDTLKGRYYEFNRTATAMFNQVAANRNDAEIVADIIQRFDIDATAAHRDLDRLKVTLTEMGALIACDPTP